MESGTQDIREGMEVLGTDGAKIGKITNIFSAEPNHAGRDAANMAGETAGDVHSADTSSDVQADPEPLRRPPIAYFESGADAGALNRQASVGAEAALEGDYGASTAGATSGATLTPSDTKYLTVHHGGLLGIGGELLYVPFNAVSAVNPGESITVNCTADECAALFGEKPEAMQDTPER